MLERFSAGFAHAFAPLYRDGFLVRHTRTDNGMGGVTTVTGNHACKVQLDAQTQRVQGSGNPETDGIALILNIGLPDEEVRDDDELTVDGRTYRLSGPALDPLASHFRCGIRRKP